MKVVPNNFDEFEGEEGKRIAAGLTSIARALDRLGNADAATPMGGMEAHGKIVAEALESGLNNIAEGLYYGLERIAEAIESHETTQAKDQS